MTFFSVLILTLNLFTTVVTAKYVFAHVVVGNTDAHTVDTWSDDIVLAKRAGIDAFALNIAHGDTSTPAQVANAFAAAAQADNGFQLFFSFDYLGGGSAWPATVDDATFSVAHYMTTYASSAQYFLYNGLPFVSTFEGTANTADWAPGGAIRSAVGEVYFVPDWTSLGTGGIGAYLDNIEGFFNWDMWPNGAVDSTDDVDKQFQTAIGAPATKTFMMGVSPWFFHSTTGGQDWVWRGDDTWHLRWMQTLDVEPDFVEIVTWNDFGESHYIGPIHSDTEIAAGATDFVENHPHDAWRDFLPYYIAAYKGTPLTVTNDQMQFWYRETPGAAASSCGVTGNIASQGQTEVDPNLIMEDKIFFSALLKSAATVEVQIGTNAAVSFAGVEGINHWNLAFNGQVGAPTFTIVRDGVAETPTTGAGTGPAILATATGACTNYNAWVGSFTV